MNDSITQSAPADAATLQWSDGFLLGYGPMDQVHEEFVDLVGRMQTAADAELLPLMDAFIVHAQAHFGEEDRWMAETNFPARECHTNEHAAVLASVMQVRELLAQGNHAVCRDLTAELVRWFPGHADYLDSALSHWMCKLRLGGKPVVLRRGWTPGRFPETNRYKVDSNRRSHTLPVSHY